ncbi:MAG: tetratricopeptide repeat protein [Bacteroidetes bacterium SB0662_bin_6]|nr:tetratricopeptide repeat protein [Bacteroidetes bacterium SB0668_bin_1]MYE04419.1 tetratricopeptide repeat protein [Bacteroidetes bacterium SB0662_bin_6]
MSLFAILLLLQSAAAPPVAQRAQDEAAGAAPPAVEQTQEPEASPEGLWAPSGKRDGRRGNDLYRQEAYDDAAAAYAGGIAILPDDAQPHLRYGLRNNLGAALLKSGNAESARQTFDQAIAEAGETGEEIDVARSAYNAGNAAFAVQDLEGALAYYRDSLLRNPDNEDARFNYEFVKRRIEEQEQQEQQNSQQQEQNQEQEQQESGNENSNNDQNEPQQDENESPQQQSGQNEQQDENEQPQNESPQEQEQQPQNRQTGEQQLSQAQAERILQALEQEEGNLLREIQRTEMRPHRVEKDW